MHKNIENNPNKPTILANKTCPYCGTDLTESNKSKEHVIGRNFVPKGTLENTWNLILYACTQCNNIKSDLEDDISAITQLISPISQYNKTEILDRKLNKSISRRTGKMISSSKEEFIIPINIAPGISLSFTCVANPQIDDERSFQLARMHLMAFFYLITFEEEINKGKFWLGSIYYLKSAIRSNWGNSLFSQFKVIIDEWEGRFSCVTADTNFKCNIRKHAQFPCWSWIIEWNQSLRLCGFFGEDSFIKNILNDIIFPKPDNELLSSDEQKIKISRDKELDSDDDTELFYTLK